MSRSVEYKIAAILWGYHNDELYEDALNDENAYIDFFNALHIECYHDRFFKSCSSCLATECYQQAKLIAENLDRIGE